MSEKKVGGAAGFARWTAAGAKQNGSDVAVGRGQQNMGFGPALESRRLGPATGCGVGDDVFQTAGRHEMDRDRGLVGLSKELKRVGSCDRSWRGRLASSCVKISLVCGSWVKPVKPAAGRDEMR